MKLVRLEDLGEEKIDWSKVRWELTPEEEAEAYRLAREAFTPADLQEYVELFASGTDLEKWGVDFGEFIDEMETARKQSEQGKQ